MSLVTSTAFQLSPPIQTRSFIAIGTLATTEVDDDFLYQILVALRNALGKANETHTMPVVGMLQCLCRLVPALQANSRYLPSLFWLAVALLQCSHIAFYLEATGLLKSVIDSMDRQEMFRAMPISVALLDGRSPLEDVAAQLDDMLKLSFDTSFSFSLASIIFKGLRHGGLREAADAVLRSLLRITVKSHASSQHGAVVARDTLPPDALGFFIALLPVSTSSLQYRQLLIDSNIDEEWFEYAGLIEEDEASAPRVSPTFMGINDITTALLACSFISTILASAQGDDIETEILYGLLADIADLFPEVVAMMYVSTHYAAYR